MKRGPDAGAVSRFGSLVSETLGLRTEDSAGDSVLQRRLEQCGTSAEEYLDGLAKNRRSEEWRTVARALTVSETYFFRNPDQFRAFSRTILPERIATAGRRRRLRVLSAGCASGEEPYSLGILLREEHPQLGEVEIDAFDINTEVIARARAGIYSAWALRETPEPVRDRYFDRQGSQWAIQGRIRGMVKFQEGNLVGGEWVGRGPFDVIFCRNLIMYLTADRAAKAVADLEAALAPGGYLLLGHAESLRGLTAGLELCHTDDTFYYRRSGERQEAEAPADGSWVELIHGASERIGALARDCAREAIPKSTAGDPAIAARLLGQERFQEALQHLDPEGDAEIQLLRAVVLTNSGETDAAEAVCERILAADATHAGAHYLLALCREQESDREGARNHHRVAIRQDPTFASPHLHLGLLAVSERDYETARGALEAALRLLPAEDAERIALFGGGFDRAALLNLCRTQLQACQAGV